ncbi:hypothetical protein C8Q76DRAFT_691243 [Earliella scabrosa]|nr:hypothetical protein C8Q76DRAFT_691243 [Earliella scabrosa]
MSEEARLQMLSVIKKLRPHPYSSRQYWAEVVLWHGELLNKLDRLPGQDPSAVSLTSLPASAQVQPDVTSSANSVTHDGLNTGGERGSARGRPKNEKCVVHAYVILNNAQEQPLHIRAEGIVRDGLVEWIFAQSAINSAIATARGPNASLGLFQYARWQPLLDSWSIYPKPHQRDWLLPGEAVLYRELEVHPTRGLDDVKARVLRSVVGAAAGLRQSSDDDSSEDELAAGHGDAGSGEKPRVEVQIEHDVPVSGSTDLIVEPAAEPANTPSVEPAVEPVVQPAVELIVEPVVQPAVELFVEPVVEPAVASTGEPAAEMVAVAPESVDDRASSMQVRRATCSRTAAAAAHARMEESTLAAVEVAQSQDVASASGTRARTASKTSEANAVEPLAPRRGTRRPRERETEEHAAGSSKKRAGKEIKGNGKKGKGKGNAA